MHFSVKALSAAAFLCLLGTRNPGATQTSASEKAEVSPQVKHAILTTGISQGQHEDGVTKAAFDEAVHLYMTGDYNAAKLCFWRISQVSPKSFKSHYYLANSFMRLGDSKNAQQWYENCLKCGHDAEISRNCLAALSYFKKSADSKAVKNESNTIKSDTGPSTGFPDKSKSGFSSPLCSPSRDTAGETVNRQLKSLPTGLVRYLDETSTPDSNISRLVQYGVESIPDKLMTKLMAAGFSIVITPTMLDAMPCKSGVSLQGYGEDSNYDNAAALFQPESKRVLIAQKLQLRKESAVFHNNDFAADAVRHELGHAYDCYAGYPSRSKDFETAYNQDKKELSAFDQNRFSYFLQPGDRGRSELFAEFFAAKYTPENWQTKRTLDLLNAFKRVIPLMKDI
jgi:hypothetical protein